MQFALPWARAFKYKIATQGVPGQDLSFANELHSDMKDLLSADEQVKVNEIILNAKASHLY